MSKTGDDDFRNDGDGGVGCDMVVMKGCFGVVLGLDSDESRKYRALVKTARRN